MSGQLSYNAGNGKVLSAADLSAIAPGTWVQINTSGLAAAAAAAGDGWGVLRDGGTASGTYVEVGRGFQEAIAGAAITAGDRITNDANGLTVTVSGTSPSKGVALTDAAASGSPVFIFVEGEGAPGETLTLTAAAESSDTIAVTVATSVASLRAIAYTVDAVTGVPDVTTTDAYTIAETGAGTPVSPAAGGGAQLIFTCSAAGAATLTVTDVAGGSDQDVHLVVLPLGRTDVPAKDLVLTFDAA